MKFKLDWQLSGIGRKGMRMLQKIQDWFYSKLARMKFDNNDDLYLFLLLNMAVLFAAIMHIVLLAIYIVAGIPFFIVINLISLFFYSVSLWMLRSRERRRYTQVGVLVTIEVIVYTFITALLTGVYNLAVFYFFMMLVMQLIIPYARVLVRGIMVGVLWACIFSWLVIALYLQPVIDTGRETVALAFFNVNFAVLGVCLEILIGNVIKKIVTAINKKQMDELTHQVHTDPLTGLFNRRYADLYFATRKQQDPGGKYSIAFLDIDDFKSINDVYGHRVGDDVLLELSKVIKTTLRKTDIVFRWGGEEFLIVLKDAETDAASRILNTLRVNIEKTTVMSGLVPVQFTVSIGVSALDMSDIEGSIANSDHKLYIGKSQGKNTVIS